MCKCPPRGVVTSRSRLCSASWRGSMSCSQESLRDWSGDVPLLCGRRSSPGHWAVVQTILWAVVQTTHGCAVPLGRIHEFGRPPLMNWCASVWAVVQTTQGCAVPLGRIHELNGRPCLTEGVPVAIQVCNFEESTAVQVVSVRYEVRVEAVQHARDKPSEVILWGSSFGLVYRYLPLRKREVIVDMQIWKNMLLRVANVVFW